MDQINYTKPTHHHFRELSSHQGSSMSPSVVFQESRCVFFTCCWALICSERAFLLRLASTLRILAPEGIT